MPEDLPDQPITQMPPPDAQEDQAYDQLVTPEQVNEVVQQFSPRTEVDDTGLTRTIFEVAGRTVAFKGRDETPVYPTLEESRPVYLSREPIRFVLEPQPELLTPSQEASLQASGSTPEELARLNQTRTDQWQSERDRLHDYTTHLTKLSEANTDKPEHLVVEQSLFGVYSLLERLQPDNPHWAEQKQKVATGTYDDESIGIIDMITAVDAIGLDATMDQQKREEHPPYGEMVVLAAIMGDEQAKQLAEAADKQQQQAEQANREAAQARSSQSQAEMYQNVEAFRPEDLVIVHSTRYRPQAGERGLEVQTTHDAVGYPRATVHTSMNHKVESHMFGSWDDADYVVISGFDRMLEANGAPNDVNGADTYWTRNPGERLVFPEATLIAPGGGQTELFTRTPQNELVYKTEGFTPADLETISQQLGAGTREAIEQSLQKANLTAQEIDSPTGRRIVANILRDALVRQEISDVRGKPILRQSDDKFMVQSDQARINKMALELGLGVSGGLHAGSDEEIIEKNAGLGDRIAGFQFSDPKIRRVAYASGMMNTGGTAKQSSDRRRRQASQNW